MDCIKTVFVTLLQSCATILCLFIIMEILWKRRWLYYHSCILPGPFSLPFIGTPSLVFAGQKSFFKNISELFKYYPTVWRFWIGSDLFIATSKAEHAEILLSNCLQKDNISLYKYIDESVSSILTQTYHRWKVNRKNINPTFSTKLMESYFVIFKKYANKTVIDLEYYCEKKTYLLWVLWANTWETALESLGEVDPTSVSLKTSEVLSMIVNYEKRIIDRITNPLYFFDFLWKISPACKKLALAKEESLNLVKEIISRRTSSQPSMKEDLSKPSFINFMRKSEPDLQEMAEEASMAFIAGSETTAILTKNVLLAMSVYPYIQKKLYEEVQSLDDDISLQELDNLNYLDRVVKETMRLLPPVPILGRYIDRTVKIDSQVFRAGSKVVIPIFHIHRQEEYWPDALKFDPDRFLPEEVNKRPRLAYMPFSHGARNCIGQKYGFIALKVLVAYIIKNFEVEQGEYINLAEVEMEYHILAKPKDSYKITLKKRK